MVFEDFFSTKWVERRPYYSLFLGIFFTLVSFGTSYFLFKTTPNLIGLSTILFTVILIVPTVEKLFSMEERYEAKEKLGFFKKHEHIFDFFIYFFIGVFITFFLISLISPKLVFSQKDLYGTTSLESANKEFTEKNSNLPDPPPPPGSDSFFTAFLKNNLYILFVSFLLSLFFGAGALFLITFNGSIFASALSEVIRTNLPNAGFVSVYAFTLCNLGIMFLHVIPEVFGYLLAAIAGGVLSQAFIREKIGSSQFWAVIMDSFVVLAVSVFVIIIAAWIEGSISINLVKNDICTNHQTIIIIIFFLIILFLVFLEAFRKKKTVKH